MYGAAAVSAARELVPGLEVREVPDVDRYTIVLGGGALAVASAVTELIAAT